MLSPLDSRGSVMTLNVQDIENSETPPPLKWSDSVPAQDSQCQFPFPGNTSSNLREFLAKPLKLSLGMVCHLTCPSCGSLISKSVQNASIMTLCCSTRSCSR